MNFKKIEKESFFNYWEPFNELLLARPHHGFEIWHIIGLFFDDLTSDMCQFVQMMCLNKGPDEAREYLDSLVENGQSWDTSDGTEYLKQ